MKRFRRPNVIAIEGDVLPAERGDLGKQKIADNLTLSAPFGNGVPEIDGVPEDDGRHSEIEAGSPVPLVLESLITDFAEAMKEHRPGERVARLALIGVCSRNGQNRTIAELF